MTDREKRAAAINNREAAQKDADAKTKTVYVVMNLKEGDRGGFVLYYESFSETKDEATIYAMKEAAASSSENKGGYPSEMIFLEEMAKTGLKLITVLPSQTEKTGKTYYFSREVNLEQKK
jgi:hypothetical protein